MADKAKDNNGRGGYRVFQNGGLRPAIRNAGGGGAVRFRHDTKSGGGGGGCCPLQARYEKRGAVRFKPDTKSGGVLSASGPIRKAGGCPLQARYEKRGGAVRFRPDTRA